MPKDSSTDDPSAVRKEMFVYQANARFEDEVGVVKYWKRGSSL